MGSRDKLSADVQLTVTAPFILTKAPTAALEPANGMKMWNKSLVGRQGTVRGKAYGELYFRGQKTVTMWRRIASDNE